jgi:hypothetical protein
MPCATAPLQPTCVTKPVLQKYKIPHKVLDLSDFPQSCDIGN